MWHKQSKQQLNHHTIVHAPKISLQQPALVVLDNAQKEEKKFDFKDVIIELFDHRFIFFISK